METPEQRRRELAAIHAAATKLGMDTADKSPSSDYRTMLHAQAGVTSAAQLDARGRKRVLRYLLTLQGPAAAPHADEPPQARKIRALWHALGKAGALKDPSPAGLAAFVRGRFAVDALRWLTALQAAQLIEALKDWLARTPGGSGR